ncbi:MAG: rRNA maturation RNase YbeY [Chloroflexota bacterium]|nr:rRNA maturation RNase YbeY [Chloroflexota bacterium]
MNEQQSQIELYVNLENDEQNTAAEHMLSTLDLDSVVKNTLQAAGISQDVLLTILIADDTMIQEMNKQYREQNKPTDVLSFPLLDKPLVYAPPEQLWSSSETSEGAVKEEPPTFVTPSELVTNLGDIAISWPTVQRQAKEAGHTTTYELLYLVAHGVLHLIGYDDHSEAGYSAMVQIQEHVLQAMGQKAQQ